jgi:predicted TIM-barrel fold metal-dependent hydrolase
MSLTRRRFGTWVAGSVATLALSSASRAATAELMPQGATDCHNHIMGPQAKYPYAATRIYTPPEASLADLRGLRVQIGVARNVIVTPSVYGFDNRCTADALAELGNTARGIAVIPPGISDAELARLNAQGFKGARLNTGSKGLAETLAAFAPRFKPLAWHVQVVGTLPTIVPFMPQLAGLGVPVVLDHFGGAPGEGGGDSKDFHALLDLVRAGNSYVKLSAPYDRSKRPDYSDMTPLARALIEAAPDRMLWGTNWPHPGQDRTIPVSQIMPYQKVDNEMLVRRLAQWCPDLPTRRRILAENPETLYGFPKTRA